VPQELDDWVEAVEAKEKEQEEQDARAAAAVESTQREGGEGQGEQGLGLTVVGQDEPPRPRASRIQRTKVCPSTCDPRWDAELLFPLHLMTLDDVLSGQDTRSDTRSETRSDTRDT
jgi:uncharacterized Ntn-hydrolase superfamily protein